MKKILWVETSWCNHRQNGHHGGIDTYRILIPIKAINKYSKKYRCESRGRIHKEGEMLEQQYQRLFFKEGFDGMIIKNNNNVAAVCQIAAMCKKYGRKLMVDLDDDLFHIDPLNPAYAAYNGCDAGLTPFRKLLKWCDGVMVENRELQKAYIDWRTHVVPNCVDDDTLKNMRKKWKKKSRWNKKINVGYFASISHKPDLIPYIKSLENIIRKYSHVNFVFFGGMPQIYDFGSIPKNRLIFVPPEDDYPDFIKKLARINIDIGIAPLKKSVFNSGRSPLKFYEYAMAGIPVVAQGGPGMPYPRVMEHGKNGLLFKSPAEFEGCLETLINGNGLGKQLRDQAYEDVKEHSIENNWQKWENFFDKMFEVNQ